ncbi:MAG: ABC transporter permease, partial [Aquihabitans sp.]
MSETGEASDAAQHQPLEGHGHRRARHRRPGRVLVATAVRVLAQLRHDPRTIALLLAAPILLIGLLAWILHATPAVFDQWGAVLLGVFPLMIMFMVTSVATLRERTGGTLERLMTMPMTKVDFLGGYAVAFGLAAIVQAVIVSAATFGPFGLSVAGPVPAVWTVAVLDALLGTSLGLFVSAFARTEFQAVQFFPALLLPQFLLCGLITPRSTLPTPLEALSKVLPLTNA